jgi:hypothetical protein
MIHLDISMHDLGYVPCLTDPDIWMKEKVREDGHTLWE